MSSFPHKCHQWHNNAPGDTTPLLDYQRINGFPTAHFVPDDDLPSAYATQHSALPIKNAADVNLWHQRLGHLSYDAVEHIPDYMDDGVEFTANTHRTRMCDTCELSRAREQVSRRPKIRATIPFDTITVDMIHETDPSLDGSRYIFHAADDATHLHFSAPITRKTEFITKLKEVLIFIRLQLNLTVRTIVLDNEFNTSEFRRWCAEHGIQLIPSAPHAHQQIGLGERAGGIISQVARSLRIEAGFPTFLWPYLYGTSTYLLNRAPIARLRWQTPISMFYKLRGWSHRPSISNLRLIGSKCYVRIPQEHSEYHPGRKLDERAWIGWLVGFNASNIWTVWLPERNRIIRARDVRIDEATLYKDNHTLVPDSTASNFTDETLTTVDLTDTMLIRDGQPEYFDQFEPLDILHSQLRSHGLSIAESTYRATELLEFSDNSNEQPSEKRVRFQLPTPEDTPQPESTSGDPPQSGSAQNDLPPSHTLPTGDSDLGLGLGEVEDAYVDAPDTPSRHNEVDTTFTEDNIIPRRTRSGRIFYMENIMQRLIEQQGLKTVFQHHQTNVADKGYISS